MRQEKTKKANYEYKEKKMKIRQSYHTRFTRFKKASATGGVCYFFFCNNIKKKKRRRRRSSSN